jgi:hypothetical protein
MLTRPGGLCILHNKQDADTKKFVHIAILTNAKIYDIIRM